MTDWSKSAEATDNNDKRPVAEQIVDGLFDAAYNIKSAVSHVAKEHDVAESTGVVVGAVALLGVVALTRGRSVIADRVALSAARPVALTDTEVLFQLGRDATAAASKMPPALRIAELPLELKPTGPLNLNLNNLPHMHYHPAVADRIWQNLQAAKAIKP